MPKDSETFFDDPKDNETDGAEGVEGQDPQDQDGEGNEQPDGEEGGKPSGDDGKDIEEQPLIEGTSFKTQEDLVKAYKSLQADYTRGQQERAEMAAIMKQIIPRLPKPQQEEVKEDPEKFLKEFVKDPRGTLNELFQKSNQQQTGAITQEVRQLKVQSEIAMFLRQHPELTDADGDGLLKVMKDYPELDSRPDRLEAYLKIYKQDNPDFAARTAQRKKDLEKGAADAKQAAAQGGRRSSTPKQPEGDEFDEILNLWKGTQAKFNRG